MINKAETDNKYNSSSNNNQNYKKEKLKLELNKELLNLLSVERAKESNRETALSKVKSERDRKHLEKLFTTERVEASERIVKFNEYIYNIILRYIERTLKNNS